MKIELQKIDPNLFFFGGAIPDIERYGGILERSMTGGDIMLQAGMTYQLEPSACFGRHRIIIGGNLIVTENGCEELNTTPCELRFV